MLAGANISAGRGWGEAGDASSPEPPRPANAPLTPEQETIAQRIAERAAELLAERLGSPAMQADKILTRAEAKAYVKRRSNSSFGQWCREYRVKPYHRGRYSRDQLDIALRFEARKRGVL